MHAASMWMSMAAGTFTSCLIILHADIDCSSVYPVAQVQQMDFSLDKDHTAWLEQEFVNGRQQGNTPTVDDFHRQLTVR